MQLNFQSAITTYCPSHFHHPQSPIFYNLTAQNGTESGEILHRASLTNSQAPATGGKKQKKKWSKGKGKNRTIQSWPVSACLHWGVVKDKANHAVVLDKATADKLQKDVQSYRLITVAVLVDRLKINGSLARKAMKDLEEKGLIKKVVGHSKMQVYSKLEHGPSTAHPD